MAASFETTELRIEFAFLLEKLRMFFLRFLYASWCVFIELKPIFRLYPKQSKYFPFQIQLRQNYYQELLNKTIGVV